jgi:ABC-type transporter lipoprotein component MlaA
VFGDVIYGLSFGYNAALPKPVRTGIGNVGHNLTFPVRLVNNCLEGKWAGAWEETKRFGVNSTLGVGGLVDAATRLRIGNSDRDFGETLGGFGAGPGFYLVIPLVGPSNARDAVGRVVDLPLDICTWIGWAYPHAGWPYFLRPGFNFNTISGEAREAKREIDSLVDPYEAFRTLYSLDRQRLVIDYRPPYGGNFNPDPTIRAVLFKPVTPDFADQAKTHRVWIAATGRKLPYSCWMQPKPAPLVCYLPGLGSYRLDRSSVAYADMLYRHGYSVVTFSDPFHKEFMEAASTQAVPGYGPADCDDIVAALKAVLGDLRARTGSQITRTCLSGVSHGGYFTLLIAAREAEGRLGALSFDRYVAVNPPPSLARAAKRLDELFDAPLAWPAAERRARMNVAVYKALYFADHGLDVSGDIPLTRIESDYLIGLAFRYTLASVIVDSQRRHNLGVLKSNPNAFVRQPSYREIREINYETYAARFVIPYLIATGRGATSEALLSATDLKAYTPLLAGNPKIRVQICEDDFLLTSSDPAWFRSTFPTHVTLYAQGGHLGNLHVPAVQERLVRLFSD